MSSSSSSPRPSPSSPGADPPREIGDRERLHAQLSQLVQLLDQALEPMFVWELSGAITFWNRGAEELYGFSRAEAVGQVSHQLLRSEHPRPLDAVEAELAALGQWQGEIRHTTRDGRTIRVESRKTLVVDPDGRRWVLEANRDVTARRLAEERLHRLQSVTASFVAAQTVEQVRRVILSDMLDALGALRIAIRRATPEGLLLDGDIVSVAGADEEFRRRVGFVPLDARHPAADAARTGRTWFIRDRAEFAARFPEWAATFSPYPGEASAHLPLLRADSVLGVLSAAFVEPSAWDEHERAFTLALVDRAAVAYERARLFEAERHARARAERLQAVTTALGSAMTPAEVYAAVLEHGFGALDAAHDEQGLAARTSSLYLLDGDVLALAGWSGFEPALIDQYRRIPLAAPVPISEAARDRRAIWLGSKADYASRYPHLAEQIRRLATESAVSIPLEFEQRAFGVLTFTFLQAHQFSPDERRFLLALGDQAAHAIERSRLFTSLRESEERFRSIFESIDEGFCIIELIFDPAGRPCDYRFLQANRAFERHTGLENAVGRTARELLPELEAFWFETYGRVALTGASARFESDARVMGRWFDVYASRVGGADSRRVAVVFNDITGRKLAEQEGARRAARQQQLVEEEQRARAAAEDAVRLREQFLSIASHELRTPLTSVIAHAQVFQRRARREGTLGERDQRSLEQILAHAGRLNRMIGGMLDVNRIDQGRLLLERAPLDLAALVRDVVEGLRETSPRHQILLGGHDAPLWVSGDALRLEQVLHNLLGNALKYSPRGGGVLVTLAADAASVRLSVRDEGIGIPARDVPHVFERFFRAHNVSADTMTGVGIGLFVVREIVALHGGTVDVHSVEGVGSTFTVTLPRVDPPSAAPPRHGAPGA